MSWLFVLLLGGAGLVLVPAFLLFFFQGRLIFPAERFMDRTPEVFGWEYEEIHLPVAGQTTYGWYVPLENARGVVLFSHGNAGNLAGRLESIGLLRSFGFSVLAYDYGGYGYSTGTPSEERCYQDANAMWDWLVTVKGVSPEQVLLFGRSLGGAMTAYLASQKKVGAVILESTFLSIPDVVRDMFPSFLPVHALISHRFPSKDRVAKIQSPTLFVHSPQDSLIPYSHGVALYQRATEPKTFLEIRGDHNEGFVLSETIYRAGWESFLAPLFPARPIP